MFHTRINWIIIPRQNSHTSKWNCGPTRRRWSEKLNIIFLMFFRRTFCKKFVHVKIMSKSVNVFLNLKFQKIFKANDIVRKLFASVIQNMIGPEQEFVNSFKRQNNFPLIRQWNIRCQLRSGVLTVQHTVEKR
jgi:hypothetical protein